MAKNNKRIRRIELEKFRGATSSTGIDFDTSKPLVVIFGENGCGKSTIGNAIDFVCNKSKGSLQFLSSTDHSHFVAIGNDPADLKIRIFRGNDAWEGTQTGRKFIVNPQDNVPNVAVLRRSELLRLVEADPAKRFETIRKFIDFAAIEKSEQKLRDADKNSKRTVETNAGLYALAQKSLNALWENDGKPGKTAESWALEKLSVDRTAAKALLISLTNAVKSIEVFEASANEFEKALLAVADSQVQLAEVEKQLSEGGTDAQNQEVVLVDMLSRVSSVIAKPYSKNECPACKSEIDLEALRKEVQERIDSLQAAKTLGETLKLKTENVKSKTDLCDAARVRLEDSVKNVREKVEIKETELAVKLKEDLDRFAALIKKADEPFESRLTPIKEALSAIKPLLSARLVEVNQDLTLYDTIKSQVDLVEQNKSDVESESAISKSLEQTLEIVRRTRLDHTQAILDDVFDDFRDYWEALHPNEPIKPTRLKLSETTKGSLNQLGSFGDHEDIAPQAYFSESHLDTLGFCYWLAIAKYSSDGGDTILVLDDVFTSVDNAHVSRVMNLLNEIADSFNQIIITTHQRRWHDKYKYGTGSKDKAHVLELDQWDKDLGIVVYPSVMEVEKLRALLDTSPLDRQAVCSKAGVLLEQILDELTKHYRSRMPRGNRAEYTLNDYVSATKELFKKLKIQKTVSESESEDLPLEKFYKDLVDFVTVRNLLGAHFNFKAEDYSDAEAIEMAELVHKCASDLLCNTCRGLALKEDKTSGAWTCECKATKMFPKSL